MPDDRAEALINEEKYEDAAARLEEVLAGNDDPGLRLRLATCHFRLGKFGDALAVARRVTEVESDHRADAVLLIAYCLRSLKRFREGARTFMDFAEKYPDSDRLRVARFSAALCLEELDDWAGAVEIYQSLDDDEAEFRKAVCLERSGRADEAAQVFEEFAAKYGDSPEMLKVRFRLGSMRMRQGRFEEAIKNLEEAVRLGGETFIGEMAKQLIGRARTKLADVSKKLKRYGN